MQMQRLPNSNRDASSRIRVNRSMRETVTSFRYIAPLVVTLLKLSTGFLKKLDLSVLSSFLFFSSSSSSCFLLSIVRKFYAFKIRQIMGIKCDSRGMYHRI